MAISGIRIQTEKKFQRAGRWVITDPRFPDYIPQGMRGRWP